MKKIINGKLYNTETAKRIGAWDNGCGYNDLSACEETLFRKITGEYFLYGEGGPMSKYARSTGNNNWSSGEEIIPLSFDAAKEWAEKHLTVEEYKSGFGEVAEDDSRITISLSISKTAAELLKRRASEAGTSVSGIVESLITRGETK